MQSQLTDNQRGRIESDVRLQQMTRNHADLTAINQDRANELATCKDLISQLEQG